MMAEIGCRPTANKAKLRFEAVDFSDIPGQSRLFLQYQTDPLSLRKYYPSAIASLTDVAGRAREVLDAYSVDRDVLCEILADQNHRFEAGTKTFDNIARLRQSKTVAVVTGQQTGLLTGPLYTIYKALSAIRLAECLRNQGVDAVPVFWAATEDHDFEEISRAVMLDDDGKQIGLELALEEGSAGKPVGSIPIPGSFAEVLRGLLIARSESDFAARLESAWAPGQTIADAFCRHIQQLFKAYGLIVVDPLDRRLKELASPIYCKAIDRADDIVSALVSRSADLVDNGYHAQVLVNQDYFPLFYHTDDGVRRAIRRQGDEAYRVVETRLVFTRAELSRIAASEPARFSPGVMLRPVVQDHLFPTVCYFGGGAEIAYFAQNSEVYRILDRPVTTIIHRQSFTLVEPKHARTLEKYDLSFKDLFAGFESLLPVIVGRFVNPTTERLFADAEENINLELNRLDQELSRIDPTLAANLATRRRKILYHIEALRKKFHRVQIQRDENLNRRLLSLFSSLWPEGQLQERVLNVETFASRYGLHFIDWLYDSVDLDDRRHRVLYL